VSGEEAGYLGEGEDEGQVEEELKRGDPLLASMSVEGMGPSLAVEDATNREVFETYLERVLAPTLRRDQVVVMDNLSAHKGGRVKELIEQRGCELIYLPPYSPDLNPRADQHSEPARIEKVAYRAASEEPDEHEQAHDYADSRGPPPRREGDKTSRHQ
jgi:hypothetical protein